MKKNRKILIILSIVLTIAVNTILESVYIFAEEGEVINIAPHVSFEVEPLKEINLTIGLGETSYSKNQMQALVNQLVIPKLRTEGIEANINIQNYDWHEPTLLDGKYYLVDRWKRAQNGSSRVDYVYPRRITDDPDMPARDLDYKDDAVYHERRILDIVVTKYDRVVILGHENYYENYDDEETVYLDFYDGQRDRYYHIKTGQVDHDGKRNENSIEDIKITEDDKVYYYTCHRYKGRYKSSAYYEYNMNTRHKREITEEEFNAVSGYNLVGFDYSYRGDITQNYIEGDYKAPQHFVHKVAPNGYKFDYYFKSVKHINPSNGYTYYTTDYNVYCGKKKVFELEPSGHHKYDIVNFMPYRSIPNIKDVSNNYGATKSYNFFCSIDNGELDEVMNEYMQSDKVDMLENFLRHDASYIAIGNSSYRSKYNNMISQNYSKGTFQDVSNINAALTNAANYIINQVINSNVPTDKILLGESIRIKDYNYDDRENDSIYNETYEINHTNPYFYENSTGRSSNISTNNKLSNYKFQNTGQFEICYYAKDNPLNNNKFDNYRKSSNIAKANILVNRRPIADYRLKFESGKISGFIDMSKDLDHTNIMNRGIVEWNWKYQNPEGEWINDFPLNKDVRYVKKIYLKVKDTDGYYSIPKIQEIDTDDARDYSGITDFLMNEEMYEGEQNKITNITKPYGTYGLREPIFNWFILDRNGSLVKDCGTAIPNLSTLKQGEYKIKLKSVQEYWGNNWHDSRKDKIAYCTKNLKVLKKPVTPPESINHPPVADFIVTETQSVNQNLIYNNLSTDPDGDNLTCYWSYSNNSGTTWSSEKTYAPTSFTTAGNYLIRLRVKDDGSPNLYSSYCIREVEILPRNTKPSANFTIDPNQVLVGEGFNIIDNSTANDSWDHIVQHQWSYSINGGTTWSSAATNPPTSFSVAGNYIIRHRVLDYGNKLSGGMWSNYYTQSITVSKLNNKPIVDFTVTPTTQLSNNRLSYTHNASDEDGDTLSYEWNYRYKNINNDGSTGNWSSWSSITTNPPSSLQCPNNVKARTYEIRLRVKDNGSPNLHSDYCVREVTILPINTKPAGYFSINPKTVLIGQEFTVTDNSNANDSWDKIIEHEWSYSSDGGTTWSNPTPMPPTIFYDKGNIKIRHRVLDEGNKLSNGIWSNYATQEISILPINHRPIADFTVTRFVKVGETLIYRDYSNANDSWDRLIKYEWSYSDNGGATWSSTSTNPPQSFNEIKDYLVRLRVKDEGNALSSAIYSDYCIQTVSVVCPENNPPVANFTVSPNPQLEGEMLSYVDNSDAGDTWDVITERKWSYFDVKNSKWSEESNNPPSTLPEGDYFIRLRVKDKGNEQYTPMWSEYCLRPITMLPINHKPIADFEMEMDLYEKMVYTDNSSVGIGDEEWDDITVYHWSWRKQNDDGTWTEWKWRIENGDGTYTDLSAEPAGNVSNIPPKAFSIEGNYQVGLKVKDKGHQLSAARWSSLCVKSIKIEFIKLFDFQITDIKDPNWKDIFRNTNNSHTGLTFKVPDMPVDENNNFLHNAAIKKGYSFYFTVNSKGLFNDLDTVKILPQFYHLHNGKRTLVDCYYPTNDNPYVKVGSIYDNVSIQYNGYSIGNFSEIILDKNVRTTINANLQLWSGKYFIHPKATFYENGKQLNINNLISTGKLLINFQIEGYRNGELKYTYVPKQWNAEGGSKAGYNDGDVIIYDIKKSVLDDFESGGIH